MHERIPEPFETKVCVDTAPLLEREYAMRAGIGWIGKNTLVLSERLGSYFVLGEIVTTLNIACDAPATDHCGTCRACLDACPTAAFIAPYRMDASRCISYLTIEHRGETIPAEFHRAMGAWVFGCDVCQQVCPHNSKAPATREPRFQARAEVAPPRSASHDRLVRRGLPPHAKRQRDPKSQTGDAETQRENRPGQSRAQ